MTDFAPGWWKTMAVVLCSGSSRNCSVRVMPTRSGLTRVNSPAWSSRFARTLSNRIWTRAKSVLVSVSSVSKIASIVVYGISYLAILRAMGQLPPLRAWLPRRQPLPVPVPAR